MRKGHWLLLAVLLGLLALVVWYGVSVWTATPPTPLYGKVIMGVAVTMALVVGCGLIALMFYSSRKGYDEPARSNREHRK